MRKQTGEAAIVSLLFLAGISGWNVFGPEPTIEAYYIPEKVQVIIDDYGYFKSDFCGSSRASACADLEGDTCTVVMNSRTSVATRLHEGKHCIGYSHREVHPMEDAPDHLPMYVNPRFKNNEPVAITKRELLEMIDTAPKKVLEGDRQ